MAQPQHKHNQNRTNQKRSTILTTGRLDSIRLSNVNGFLKITRWLVVIFDILAKVMLYVFCEWCRSCSLHFNYKLVLSNFRCCCFRRLSSSSASLSPSSTAVDSLNDPIHVNQSHWDHGMLCLCHIECSTVHLIDWKRNEMKRLEPGK